MKNNNIIPIVYMGGTGGNFLGYLLTSAKLKITDGIVFSKYGNAHESIKEINQPPLGNTIQGTMDDTMLDLILNIKPINHKSQPPYFCPCHVKHMNRVKDLFQTSIQITYEKEDIDDLALIFMGKWWIDSKNRSKLLVNSTSVINLFKLDYNVHLLNYPPIIDPSVLIVTWHELFKGDSALLVQKLSHFTSIPKENFLVNKLIEWRRRTKNGIEEIQTLLNVAK
jgi:hypothetical protein